VLGIFVALVALTGVLPAGVSASPSALTGVDLSKYVRVGRFDLPEPSRTPAPANSLLAQEASSVTYDWDTDTLFVVGDGGTSVVQVTKTGQLINSMTLAPGSSPQGTEFYDTEGITYVGGGQFVMTEERDRQVVRFTYIAGGTLTRAAAQTVKLGTTVGNIGLEGVANDPLTGGFILVKEKQPQSIFQTGIDWAAGTATNGSPTTDESVDLFSPALVGTADFSDVFSLANVSTLTGPDSSHLLVLSQESGKIVNVDRSGNVSSTLTIQSDPGNPLSVPDQTHEGVTMDNDGTIYTVSEDGGGDITHPQLWVYKHTDATNQAATGVLLSNTVSSIAENTSTLGGIKVADITVLDDGLGTNNLTVSGPDAASFQIAGGSLFIKPGTVLDFETKPVYTITVNADDPTIGATPDASATYTLNLIDVANETAAPGSVVISETAPWASGNTAYAADWFEATNLGGTTVDISGWRMDDNSYSPGSSVALRGVTSIGAGRSVIFLESGTSPGPADATLIKAFCQAWWGTDTPPAGVAIGTYGGSGVGLSTGGDAVNLFNGLGSRVTGVSFGASPSASPFRSFDNTAGLGGVNTPAPTISLLSAVSVHGAFTAHDGTEIGSPGVDYLPPAFTDIPFDLTAEATGATTPVSFTAPTATDLVDGARPVACTPASSSAFALGTTTVNCSASDTAGNSATASFHVTVRDTKPPVVNVPADITVEATGTLTPVPFGPVTATDTVDGSLPVTCSPAAPGPFPVGTTHIDCFTVDAQGNRGSAPFNVTVVDTTPPVVTVPGNKTVDAATPAGRAVTFTASASDAVDGSPTVTCLPASGSTFPIGTTIVRCTATDAQGNAGSATFTITVADTARTLTESALISAKTLLSGAAKHDVDELKDIVKKLTDAADASNWVDGNRLVVRGGESVFNDDQEATDKLAELIKNSTIADATLRSLIDQLVRADALLATTAIDDAVAAGTRPQQLAEARDELAKAARALAKGNPADAIDHYKDAWKKAVSAAK
ncbi:MAG TPA: SdiA-regulated domain-containing protein, partial [Gaiellaceae bacterium]|nr:SdiA-regulated domain-containing protein [Gaiellaceae bacterium]